MSVKKGLVSALALAAAGMLAGCATSTPAPTAAPGVQARPISGFSELAIRSEVAQGVAMPQQDQDRVVDLVRTELTRRAPGRFTFVGGGGVPAPTAPAVLGQPAVAAEVRAPAAAPMAGRSLDMSIQFTEFDRGSGVARLMLAGLGQIRIATRVSLRDAATGEPLGSWDVSKQFAFGGIYGAATGPEEVEVGLASGIAEILVPSPK